MLAAAWGYETLPGINDPYPLLYTNSTTLLFWVIWFMGLVFTAPLVGRLWCGVCPLGYLSDRLGRRRMLAIYIAGAAIVTIFFAWTMQHYGWIMPVDVDAPDRPLVPAMLVTGE